MYAAWSAVTCTPRSSSAWFSAYAASTNTRRTPGKPRRAASSCVVLPGSVSTRVQPARDSVVAIRAAGKCGSTGRYTPPALKTPITAAIQSRSRSVITATTPSRRRPRASSARPIRFARAFSSP